MVRTITQIRAFIVSVANNNTEVAKSQYLVVQSSAEAETDCARLDDGQTTRTYVLKYVVTYDGGEGLGYEYTYTPQDFKRIIEAAK